MYGKRSEMLLVFNMKSAKFQQLVRIAFTANVDVSLFTGWVMQNLMLE